MLDIENVVFTLVNEAVSEANPKAKCYGELIDIPPSFPCVTVEEKDNYVPEKYREGNKEEKYTQLMYEINVYSNKSTGKKSEARALLNAVDKVLNYNGFRRTTANAVTMEDTHIYRMVARYSAIVDDEYFVYGG